MNTREHDWTDAELELFHDGELRGSRGDELSAALRTSPELRARAASIARADGLYTRALALEPARSAAASTHPFTRPWLRAAAALLLLAGLAGLARVWWIASRSAQPLAPGEQLARHEPAPTPTPVPEPYRAVRVVFSLPIGKAGPIQPRPPAPIAAPPDQPAPEFIAQLDEALAAGRVEEAIKLVKNAGPGDKEEAYRRFGGALRSSDTAMAALDSLEPQEQVAACKQWIAAGQQRPFAMARLKMLSRRPELEEPIRIAVRELLADDPNLRTWVMSYVPWTLEKS
ncbi:MAG: hypothetical protein IT436_16650 [Phycisphaerales bacterium]|nr:hypothetical protein [Phycisphaerales bacterium]